VDKQCSRCGQVKPVEEFGKRPKNKDGLMGWCKACYQVWHREWYQNNKEKVRQKSRNYAKTEKRQEYLKKYREENKERTREYHKQYYEENKKKHLEQGKQRYYENRDEILAKQRASRKGRQKERNEALKDWARRNPEKRRKQKERYKKRHPERHRLLDCEYSRKRRAIKAEADGFYTVEQWLELLEVCNNRCLKCGAVENLEADHVKPLSRGGSDWITNIQPLCRPCNCEKHAHTADYRTPHIKQWTEAQRKRRAREAREVETE